MDVHLKSDNSLMPFEIPSGSIRLELQAQADQAEWVRGLEVSGGVPTPIMLMNKHKMRIYKMLPWYKIPPPCRIMFEHPLRVVYVARTIHSQ